MARRISEKLDNVTYEDLGIQFDEGLIWEKLDARLGDETKALPIRWMVAAAIFLGMLLFPFTVLKEEFSANPNAEIAYRIDEAIQTPTEVDQSEELVSIANTKSDKIATEVHLVRTKKLEVEYASIVYPTLTQVEFNVASEQKIMPQFAVEDISIIQASLEDASINDTRINKGRIMSIRAQEQTSSIDEQNDEPYQGLKIKLYGQKN